MHPTPPPRPGNIPAMASIAPPVFLPPAQVAGAVYTPVLGAKWTPDANFYDSTKLYGFQLPRLIKGTAVNAGADYWV